MMYRQWSGGCLFIRARDRITSRRQAESQELLHLAGRITARARETAGLRCAPLMDAVL